MHHAFARYSVELREPVCVGYGRAKRSLTLRQVVLVLHRAVNAQTREGQIGRESAGLLSVVKDAVLPLAIYGYFAGFIYIYYFYQRLGISLSGIEVPFYSFFLYAYNVVAVHPWLTVGLLVGTLVAIVLSAELKYGYLVVALVLVAVFPLLYWLASSAAAADIHAVRTRQYQVPQISFVFKDASQYPPELVEANHDRALRMILETKDHYYVLDQPYDDSDDVISEGSVYSVAKSDVVASRVHLLQAGRNE